MYNNNEKKKLEKDLKDAGYRPSSSGSGWTNGSGGTVKPAGNGSSFNINGVVYTDYSNGKKSNRY